MADLCAPASSVPALPSTSAPPGAQQLAAGLNDAITSGEVQAALPLLNNGKSCAKSGWPAELLRYAYKEVTMEDGKVSKLYMLAPILAALLSTGHQLFALRHFIDRSKSQQQPLFAAFVDLKKAYDSVQHPLLWAALQRKGIHGKMLAGIQSFYDGGGMSMKISGSSGASGTARVGVRQACPLSPTLFGIFFDSLDAQLQAESAAAGVECRGVRVPGLFYADGTGAAAAAGHHAVVLCHQRAYNQRLKD